MRGVFTRTFTVPESAIDMNGHASNLEYLRWMQEAATEHSAAQGWPIERYLATGTTWMVRSHEITYRRPAHAGDAISLLTWVAGFRDPLSSRGYLFWRAEDQQVLAKAETRWVFVDTTSGCPARIPDEFKTAFELVPQEAEILRYVRGR